ncbi:hypothetical protein FISHEDRAFT_69809 [Fistulina hepatica ATCC 64428]|uniref:Uncharacterized protein n=1 Tax=Fistulina hepatica ATCC 64428 TaxID=1128425 RepID=A0A0D7ALE6_9AGAR|nr:hypothetical protein FISHEDRAFT_69809 [Fistulina hepatica ATCC 64428]
MSISGFCALIHKTLVFVALESNQSTLSDIVSTVEHLHKQRCGCALSTGSDAWVEDSIEELNRHDISECPPSSDSGFFSSGGSSSSHERRYLGVGDCVRDLRCPVVFSATHGKPSTREQDTFLYVFHMFITLCKQYPTFLDAVVQLDVVMDLGV